MIDTGFIESMPWLTPVVIGVVGLLIAYQARRHLTTAVIGLQLFLLFVGCWGAYRLEVRQDNQQEQSDQIERTQNRLTHERKVRSRVQSEINRYVCNENNKQDRILAGLVQVALGGQTTFGQGLDKASLTTFDLEVIATINRVQELGESGGQGSPFRAAYEKALRQLEAETPCKRLVAAFLVASTTDDLKAVRDILRNASADAGDAVRQKNRKSQAPAKP